MKKIQFSNIDIKYYQIFSYQTRKNNDVLINYLKLKTTNIFEDMKNLRFILVEELM